MIETNEIKEIEKKVHGTVKIGFDKPKKVKKIKKHLFVENEVLAEKSIKGDFDEKTPIQNIKSIKKTHYKPFVSKIPEEKVIIETKIEDLQKEIDNQKKALELKIKEAQAEKVKLLKEEKAKRKAEKKERRRKHWYFRMFMKKEKKLMEIKEAYSNPNEVKLIELDYTNLKRCPICNKKIKKYKVEYDLNTLKQLIKCKKCNFQKLIAIKL